MTESSLSALEPALRRWAEYDIQAARHALAANRQRARHLLRASVVALACLALVNVHFIYLLTEEFGDMIHRMVSMYEHFGRVAERMNDMTDEVVAMENEVRLMPIMSQQTGSMKHSIVGMAADIDLMARDVAQMRQRVGGMNQDMMIMARQFHQLNVNVGAMGVDVRHMANTVP